MGQQPNVEVAPEERSRQALDTSPSVGWRSDKPGIPKGPADVRRGGSFGMIGPDPGWAWKVVDRYPLPNDDPRLRAVIGGLVMARAAALGRAAVRADVEAAIAICGYDGDARPEMVDRRDRWLESTAHEARPGAAAVSEVDLRLLVEKPERIRWANRHAESV